MVVLAVGLTMPVVTVYANVLGVAGNGMGPRELPWHVRRTSLAASLFLALFIVRSALAGGAERSPIDTYRDLHELRIPVQSLPRTRSGRITGDTLVPQLLFVRDGEIARTWSIAFPEVEDLRDLLNSDRPG